MSARSGASGLSRFLTLGLAAMLFSAWTMTAQSGSPSAPIQKPGRFVDVTTVSGVHFEGQAYHTAKKYLMETMGSGVALFDYDNDGRLDIFFANGAPLSDPTAPGTIPQKAGRKDWNRLTTKSKMEPLKTLPRKRAWPGRAMTWASRRAITTMTVTKIYT